MALAISALDTSVTNTNAASHTSDANQISVVADDLVIVTLTVASGSAFTYSSISDTIGTLTWTKEAENLVNVSGTNRHFLFWAKATGTATGAVTVTVAGGTPGRWLMHAYKVTGQHLTTPLVAGQTTVKTNATAASDSLTLGATPAATSLVFGSCFSAAQGVVTNGANYTELYDDAGSSISHLQDQYDLTNATTTVDWSSLGTTQNSFIAIEIQEASAGASSAQPSTTLTMLGVQ